VTSRSTTSSMIGSSTDLPAGQGSGHPHPYQLGPWPRSLRCQARLWWAASSRCGSRVPSMSGMARRIRRTPRSGLRCPIASARDTSDRAARWCSPTRLGARDLSRRQRPELSNLALCLMRLGRSRDRPGPLPRGGGRRGLREAHVTVQKDVKARSPLPRRPPVVAPYTTRPPPLVVPDTSCSESELVPGGLRTRGAHVLRRRGRPSTCPQDRVAATPTPTNLGLPAKLAPGLAIMLLRARRAAGGSIGPIADDGSGILAIVAPGPAGGLASAVGQHTKNATDTFRPHPNRAALQRDVRQSPVVKSRRMRLPLMW
jgi:hypothetical protein